MSTNQENRHFTFKEQHNPGGAAVKLEEDHLLGYRSAGGQATGTINETRLDFINKQLVPTYASLPEAMQAYAENQGFTNWSSIGGKNTDEPPLPLQGKSAVSESGGLITISFDLAISATPAQEAVGWEIWAGRRQISLGGGTISTTELQLTNEGEPVKKHERPVLAYYNAAQGSLKGSAPPGLNVTSIFGLEVANGSQQ